MAGSMYGTSSKVPVWAGGVAVWAAGLGKLQMAGGRNRTCQRTALMVMVMVMAMLQR